jgi:hypothetical protein
MPDDFTQRFQYGLNNLPVEPPDDPNTLFSPSGFTSIGMQRAGEAQVVPAQFRSLGRQVAPPPGYYPDQGRGLAPGGGPVTEIPIPQAWKLWGPILGAGVQFLPNIIAGPDAGGWEKDGEGCKEEWDAARRECARELAKPNPSRSATGGRTTVEGCARGKVSEVCGGNPYDEGPAKPRKKYKLK